MPATEYTLSFYAKGSGELRTFVFPNTDATILATNGDPEFIGQLRSDGRCEYPLTSEWKRYFVTFRTTDDTTKIAPAGTKKTVLFRVVTGSNEAYICGAKLEKGNVATDWSPAPEDSDSGLSFIKQIFPDGLIDNKATISQLLAVKDSTAANANIVAGIYGGGVEELEKKGFLDDDHGKLMIFAGAENIDKVSQANTRIYEDGTIVTKKLVATDSELTNATINGCVYNSMRSPFSLASNYNIKSDNYSSAFNGTFFDLYLPDTVDNNGRRLIFADAKWGNIPTTGTKILQFKDPETTCRFFEDGLEKETIKLSNEIVELIGYGTPDTFYGWIVLNRKNILTEGRYGHPLNVMAQGYVYGTNNPNTTYIKYKTFDGQSLSVSRQDVGIYVVNLPNNWFTSSEDYMVMLTGVGAVIDTPSSPNKATLYKRTITSFTVWCSDDNTKNDGSFFFQIINLNDWYWLN